MLISLTEIPLILGIYPIIGNLILFLSHIIQFFITYNISVLLTKKHIE